MPSFHNGSDIDHKEKYLIWSVKIGKVVHLLTPQILREVKLAAKFDDDCFRFCYQNQTTKLAIWALWPWKISQGQPSIKTRPRRYGIEALYKVQCPTPWPLIYQEFDQNKTCIVELWDL